MIGDNVRIFPLGDSALTVEFGTTISTSLNKKSIALSTFFERHPFAGFVESVPAYASTTIFYDLITVRKIFSDFPSAFEKVRSLAVEALKHLDWFVDDSFQTVEIPVSFDSESSLDLALIADRSKLSKTEVIKFFLAATYRVYMLGFLPGFTYMGEVDERIAMPRKESPRTLVPKGSVGIAGRQTGVYSLASPGGWQIIGRTEMEMFTPNDATPSRLRAGDLVRFVRARK